MLELFLSLFLFHSAAFAAPSAAPPEALADLTSGRYDIKVSGMLCSACGRAVLKELSKLEELESVKPDPGQDRVTVVVKLQKVLRISTLRRSLRRAARKVNLGTSFEVESVRYRP